MRRGSRLALPAAVLLAACRGSGEADRWRYERILHEEDPSVGSREDARRRYRELADRPEITVGDAYRMALHRSEALAIDGEELIRLQARYEQSRAALLP